jgi:CRP/FNR family cyclic AMP-dependent transcriptional regulator
MISLEELKKIEIFKELNDAELENIVEIAEKEKLDSGVRIFEEKSWATYFYIVEKGVVEIKMSRKKSGKQITIETVGPGEIFGWSSVTEPYNFTASAWTCEKTELLKLKGERLRDLFKKNNHIGYKFIMRVASVISSRLRHLSQRLTNSM